MIMRIKAFVPKENGLRASLLLPPTANSDDAAQTFATITPGDGIGPEVMAEVEKVINYFVGAGVAQFEVEKGLVGGCAFDAHGSAIS